MYIFLADVYFCHSITFFPWDFFCVGRLHLTVVQEPFLVVISPFSIELINHTLIILDDATLNALSNGIWVLVVVNNKSLVAMVMAASPEMVGEYEYFR